MQLQSKKKKKKKKLIKKSNDRFTIFNIIIIQYSK